MDCDTLSYLCLHSRVDILTMVIVVIRFVGVVVGAYPQVPRKVAVRFDISHTYQSWFAN